MSKESLEYLQLREISNDLLDGDFYLSELLDAYVKFYNKEHIKVPIEEIGVRREKFSIRVHSVGKNLSSELLSDFIDYWTEHNEGGRKMRFETHKIFNIAKRLRTWSNNHKKFNKTQVKNERYNVGKQDYNAKLADARPGLFD